MTSFTENLHKICAGILTHKKILAIIAFCVSVALTVGVLVYLFVERSPKSNDFYLPASSGVLSRSNVHMDDPITELKPYPYYYLPAILDIKVSFDKAHGECEWHAGYTLAGLNTANSRFLENTVEMFKHFTGAGVWVGGYFDLASDHPYLVHWTDGKVSDSLKSPQGIWCEPLGDVIPKLIGFANEKIGETSASKKLMVPIVRLANATCLTLHDIFANPHKKFAPFCVTQDASMYVSIENDIEQVVPKFFNGLFDVEKVGILRVHEELQRSTDPTLDARYPVRFNKSEFLSYGMMMVGFPQLVDYEYAKSICTTVRHNDNPGKVLGGQLLFHYLNSIVDELRRSIAVSYERLATMNLTDQLYMTTSGYFDFNPRASNNANLSNLLWEDAAVIDLNETQLVKMARDYCKNETEYLNWEVLMKTEYRELVFNCTKEFWDGFKPEQWSAAVPFGWCSSGTSAPIQTLELVAVLHNEFDRWYKEQGGSLTTGPYRLQVAIATKNGLPCLELVPSDLYWPGAHSFVPVCEILP